MAGKSQYLEGQILNLIYRTQSAWKPGGIHMALFSAVPGDAGGGTEVTGGNYARQQIAQDDVEWTAPAGTPRGTSNVDEIQWQGVTWSGSVVAWALMDAATDGNILYWSDCADKVVNSGDTVVFLSGEITITEDAIVLLGSAWQGSTSLTDYPKTGPVTSGGPIVDIDDGSGGKTLEQRLADALALLSSNDRVLIRNNSGAPVVLTARLSRSTAWGTEKQVFAYGTQRIWIRDDHIGAGTSGCTMQFSGANEFWKGFELTGNANSDVSTGYIHLTAAASGNTIEDFWLHGNTGVRAAAMSFFGGQDHLIQDTLAWGNPSGTGTNAADGFMVEYGGGTDVAENVSLVRCLSVHAGDDGFDFIGAHNSRAIDCVAVYSGYDENGDPTDGDGNGFKMGGSNRTGSGSNLFKGCFTAHTAGDGFDDNAQPGLTTAIHCTQHDAVGYGYTFSDAASVCTDNIGWVAGNGFEADGTNLRNSWILENTDPKFADAASGDYSLLGDSPYLTDGDGGVPLGASSIALLLLKENWDKV